MDAAAALSSSDRPDSLLAWLLAVAERRFIDELRRGRRRVEELDDCIHELPSRRPEFYGQNIAAALERAIARLPPEQQKVVSMKLFEERPFAEIAELLDTTEAACKMRFSRGLAQVRDALRREGIGP